MNFSPDQKYHIYRFKSTITYKKDNKIICGLDASSHTEGDIFILDIKRLLFDIEKEDENLGIMKSGLTVRKVFADYLSYFTEYAFERLKEDPEFQFKDLCGPDIRYCFVCPQSLQGFISECFVESGIIQEHDIKEQLSFATEVEAMAHHLISLERQTTNLIPNQNYLLCNVSEIAFGIAEIKVETTESLSTVVLLHESSEYGSTALQVKFKEYLEKNKVLLNLSHQDISSLVAYFIRDIKVIYKFYSFNVGKVFLIISPIKFDFRMNDPKANAFKTEDIELIEFSYKDLNRIVFLPFIKSLTERIIGSYSSLDNRKLLLSGKYGCDPFFIDTLLYDSDKSFLEYVVKLNESAGLFPSSGAVSSTMRTHEVQIPLCSNVIEEDQSHTIKEINTREGYDFLVGIGQ